MPSSTLQTAEGGALHLSELRTQSDLSAELDLLLCSGGGDEVWPNASTRRTADGAGVGPDDAEIWFSSTTATSPGRYGRAAARMALERLAGVDGAPMPLTIWFNGLRSQIAAAAGAPDAAVLLAPSPREAASLARFIATIHFGSIPAEVTVAETESGLAVAHSDAMALRDAEGAPLPQAAIDARALTLARTTFEHSGCVLTYALDLSRSGLAGISRAAARRIRDWAPERALTVVDASDWRLAPGALADDLAAGAMAIVSGSRFLAGPAHCAALIVPASLAAQLDDAAPRFDADAAAARFDVPARLRRLFDGGFEALLNVGLGLRWTAALAEYDRYAAIPEPTCGAILDAFSRKARALAARCAFLDLEPRPLDEDDPLRASILTLFPRDARGRVGWIGANALRAGLALPRPAVAGDAVCHVGAPVRAGGAAALPLSASAPMLADVYARMRAGVSFERAVAPVFRDLKTLFVKWGALAG